MNDRFTASIKRPLLLNTEQVAEILGLSVWRVEELYRGGDLEAVRTAGTDENPRGIRFTFESIDKYRASLPVYTPPTVKRRKRNQPNV